MPGSARSHCRECAQGKQPGRPRHSSTVIGKPRWDEGFPGMPQASFPTLTVISEIVANDGQNSRHIAEHQRGTISGR